MMPSPYAVEANRQSGRKIRRGTLYQAGLPAAFPAFDWPEAVSGQSHLHYEKGDKGATAAQCFNEA